jgi:hypothetical protein
MSAERSPSDRELKERAARQAAKERQSSTSILLGEPPPGFSALDRRRAEAEAAAEASGRSLPRSSNQTAGALTALMRRRWQSKHGPP